MYQLVNAITYEIIDPASPNSVFGFFMRRSQMGSYLGHLDLLVKIADAASPNSVFVFFMDFNETLHIDSLRGMCPTNLNGRIMHRAMLLLLLSNIARIFSIF